MNQATLLGDTSPITVLTAAEVTSRTPEEYNRNAPSRYADPVAWLAVEAAARALSDTPQVPAAGEETAVVAVSEHGTSDTMHSICRRMTAGRLSPLHFAGANPGLLAGAVCIQWRLRGPSLALTMPPALGLAPARLMARSWLDSGQARYVLGITHEVDEDRHIATCQVWGRTS